MRSRSFYILAITSLVAGALLLSGCSNNPNGGAVNRNAGGTVSAGSAANKPAKPDPILTKEPDRYSETITIDVQPPGTPQDNHIPPLQFGFTRIGGDRRAEFQVAPAGQMIYLEHSGLKYMVLPAHKQYVELDLRALGIQLPRLELLTPTSVVNHIKEHSTYENLGVEQVNGRNAVKYKFDGQGQTSTFFLDETTGLPVRAEIVGGAEGERIMMEMRNVQLNPEISLFDIPIGYRKVAQQQVRPEVDALAQTLRRITDAMENQGAQPRPTPSVSPSENPSGSPSPRPNLSPSPNPPSAKGKEIRKRH